MVETPRIRVAVLEGQYACLVDQGVPFSVCLRLQQLGLQLNQAQWTARNSLGGFSIAFFWPALEKNPQPTKKVKKVKKKRVKVKSTPVHISPPVSNLHISGSDAPRELAHLRLAKSKGSPIDAHCDRPSFSLPAPSIEPPLSLTESSSILPPSAELLPSDEHHDRASSSSPSSTEPPLSASPSPSKSTTAELSQGLDLSKCQDVRYESRDYIPGVSYKSVDGEEGWTPVIRRKRKTVRLRRSSESESSTSGSEVDVSCSRKVEYEKRNEIPGLNIYRRGPVEWTPIQAATCTNPVEPIAARTRSKTYKI